MYEYRCPYCGEKNYSEFIREYTDEYKKYRTDVCAKGTCHRSFLYDTDFPFYRSGGLQYHIVTSLDICAACDDRLDCFITPVVIAKVVPKEKALLRKRSWRNKISD